MKCLTPSPCTKPTKVLQHFFFQHGILEADPNLNSWQKNFWAQSPLGVVAVYPIFRPKFKVKPVFPLTCHMLHPEKLF